MAKSSSAAVMASKRAGDSFELFPTPPWGTRALLEQELLPRGWVSEKMTAWDPCCGRGHMALPLADYFRSVFSTDIHDWGFGDRRALDFTFADAEDAPWPVDWIIANPPFTLAEPFLFKALSIVQRGVALLVRLQWLEGGERFRNVWSGLDRPHLVCPFADRLPMIEDVWDPEVSSATAYMWLVWAYGEPRPSWPIAHIQPGAEKRYSRIADLALATPGEAARRRKAKKDGMSVDEAVALGEAPDLSAVSRLGRGRHLVDLVPETRRHHRKRTGERHVVVGNLALNVGFDRALVEGQTTDLLGGENASEIGGNRHRIDGVGAAGDERTDGDGGKNDLTHGSDNSGFGSSRKEPRQ